MDDLDFVILGLATCWQRDEDNQLTQIRLIEPVPSAAFLTLLKDVPSSFAWVTAIDPRTITEGEKPHGFPQDAIVPGDFNERLMAAARTFRHDPTAKAHLPIGQTLKLNQPLKHKRVINQVHSVADHDNVKQHPLSHQSL